MCTAEEGRRMTKVFREYYSGKAVEDSDMEMLDRLCVSSFIEFYMDDGSLHARASRTGRSLVPTRSVL